MLRESKLEVVPTGVIVWASQLATLHGEPAQRVPHILHGWHAARDMNSVTDLTAEDLFELATMISPMNAMGFRKGEDVNSAKLAESVNYLLHDPDIGAKEWYSNFVKISPFRFGNAIVASIIWNRLAGNPEDKPLLSPSPVHVLIGN